MEKDAASALRALASESGARSKIGRLRELHQEIENAHAAGVSLGKIVEALNEQGLELNLPTFKQMLKRIRKEVAGGKAVPPVTAKAVPPASLTPKKEGVVAKPAAVATPATPAKQAQPKKPGEPERFDWEEMKDQKPEW